MGSSQSQSKSQTQSQSSSESQSSPIKTTEYFSTKSEDEESDNDLEDHNQWAYKVFPCDDNYDERTDRINDYMDYDPDQNDCLEGLYQQCQQTGRAPTGLVITGDQGQVRNGWVYKIYGTSNKDISTWTQENTETHKKRKLRRLEMDKEQINQMKIQKEELKNRKADYLPAYWDQNQKENFISINLKENSIEFDKVKNFFIQSMNKNKILQIERIQNLKSWQNYKLKRKEIQNKYKNKAIEYYLFHGTSKTQPKIICKHDIGFDVDKCSWGLWGKAIYFAVNASYSGTGYQYDVNSTKKQIILARVIVGKFKYKKSDDSMTEPPMNGKKRYDSVKGIASGSYIFMVYENSRAYPEYLITYE